VQFTRLIPLIFILLVLLFVGVVKADTPIVIVTDDKMALPTTVTTDSGTYLVIPNYTTGKPMAVIQTSRTEDKD
jgi:hypothetical protein